MSVLKYCVELSMQYTNGRLVSYSTDVRGLKARAATS